MRRVAAVLTLAVLTVVAAQSTLSSAVILLGAIAVFIALWLQRSCPRRSWPLAWAAVAGWVVACFAVSFSVSIMHVFYLATTNAEAPQPSWVYLRAFTGGILLAVVPMTVMLWLVRRAVGNGVSEGP